MRLKGGHSTQDPRLDRVPSATDEHLRRYPFTAQLAADVGVTTPTPIIIGVNWYSVFDTPVQGRDRRWRVAADGNLGTRRGGHCVCLPHKGFRDARGWYPYYNQGQEGRCVQFGTSRAMSLLNRKRYEIAETDVGRWLYWEAQRTDEWEGGSYPGGHPHYEGTSVRAALEIVRAQGIIPARRSAPSPTDGITAYRWAASIEDVLVALGREGASEIPWLNSWGLGYPRIVYVPVDVHARLHAEDGEYGLITDR